MRNRHGGSRWVVGALFAPVLFAFGGGCAGEGTRTDAVVNMCFPDAPTTCASTCTQAGAILKEHCAYCHAAGMGSQGFPRFDFVLDIDRLVTETWPREGIRPLRFVMPGHPDDSIVYVRPVVLKDMPPIARSVDQPHYPRVPTDQGAVLRRWIGSCIGSEN